MILHRLRIVLHSRENDHARIPARNAAEAFRTSKNGATVIDTGASGRSLIQLFEQSIQRKEPIFGSNISSLRVLDPLGF
tara:strand:- start:663 stop:899 length:237 start_codon:yes stop_codon:yes gene_type:complete